MSNPLLSPDRFQPAAGPPAAWPDGTAAGTAAGGAAGGAAPSGPGSYGAPGTLGGPGGGHGAAHGAPPVPPAPDNRAGSPWPPPPAGTAAPTLRRAGVASATGVLLAIMCVLGVVGWRLVTITTSVGLDESGQPVETRSPEVPGWLYGVVVATFLLVILSAFKPETARFTAPVYAAGQGLFVGAVSHVFEAFYPGIVVQAVGLTIAVFSVMLVLYATGRIRVTPRLRTGIIAATMGVAAFYLAAFVFSLFGGSVPFINDSGPVGIAFSLAVVAIAAFNLTLDFDFIDRAEQAGAPRSMEWFAALSLLVTLVWLYLEVLRLLAKLRE